MSENDQTVPRETGSAKDEAQCSNCGGSVPQIETAYGSTAPGACPKCYPSESRETAGEESASPPRELGTDASAGSQEGEH